MRTTIQFRDQHGPVTEREVADLPVLPVGTALSFPGTVETEIDGTAYEVTIVIEGDSVRQVVYCR